MTTERLNYLENNFSVTTTKVNEIVIQFSDVIILCIKPQMAQKVLSPLQNELQLKKKPTLIISILAGTSLSKLETYFNLAVNKHVKIIRAMPNTPALVGEGAAGVVFTPQISNAEREITTKLLQSCSKSCRFFG